MNFEKSLTNFTSCLMQLLSYKRVNSMTLSANELLKILIYKCFSPSALPPLHATHRPLKSVTA